MVIPIPHRTFKGVRLFLIIEQKITPGTPCQTAAKLQTREPRALVRGQ